MKARDREVSFIMANQWIVPFAPGLVSDTHDQTQGRRLAGTVTAYNQFLDHDGLNPRAHPLGAQDSQSFCRFIILVSSPRYDVRLVISPRYRDPSRP